MLKLLEQKGSKSLVLKPRRDEPFEANGSILNAPPPPQKLVGPKEFARRTISNLLPKHFFIAPKSPAEERQLNWTFHKPLLYEF